MAIYVHNENCVTPQMTDFNVPSPFVVSASNYYTTYYPWNAFDHSNNLPAWTVRDVSFPEWIKIDLGNGRNITQYTISFNFDGDSAPKDWLLQGSNNDIDWTTVDTVVGEIDWGSYIDGMREYEVDSPGTYRYYRIYVTANNGHLLFLSIGEIELIDTSVYLDSEPFSLTSSIDVSLLYSLPIPSFELVSNVEINDIFIGTPIQTPEFTSSLSFDQATTFLTFVADDMNLDSSLTANITVGKYLIVSPFSATSNIEITGITPIIVPPALIATSSLDVSIHPTLLVSPFVINGSMEGAPVYIALVPAFDSSFSMEASIRNFYKSSLSLVNGIKMSSNISLINSLNEEIASDQSLLNNILQPINGTMALKLDINELVKLKGSESIINSIHDDDSGIANGQFYFLKSHGI